MADLILPTIGSSGYFELRAPFDTVILPGERYTCQAIRRLSDCLANNETPLTDIYTAKGLTESDYDEDLKKDMYIVSLQADKGHWVYVPASYLVKYPDTNGIPYRSLMIAVSLPMLPVNRDLSFLQVAITNLVKDSIGVDSKAKLVETSKVLLVTKEKHDITQSQRDAIAAGKTTDRARYISELSTNDSLRAKVAELEAFIAANYQP